MSDFDPCLPLHFFGYHIEDRPHLGGRREEEEEGGGGRREEEGGGERRRGRLICI